MNDYFSDFATRVRNLAPLQYLATRTQDFQPSYAAYPLYSMALGMLILLYEGMLINEYHSAQTLADEMRKRWHGVFGPDNQGDIDSIVQVLLFSVLQNDGVPYVYKGIVPTTGSVLEVSVKLVETADFDISQFHATFRLTSQGLELLYASKEIPGELQLTIEQLYLRQQYEGGHFNQALQHIQNIYQIIRLLSQEMDQTNRALMADAFSVQFEDFEQVIRRKTEINQREKKEFMLLHTKVRQDRKGVEDQEIRSLKDDEALLMLRRIEEQLRGLMKEHVQLLNKTQDLNARFLESRRQRIALALRRQIHYRNDIFTPCIEENPPIEMAYHGIYFLFRQRPQHFSPLWCFQNQQPKVERSEETEMADDYSPDEAAAELLAEQRRREAFFYRRALDRFIRSMTPGKPLAISEFLVGLDDGARQEYENSFHFFFIFMQLYRIGALDLSKLTREDLIYSENEPVDIIQIIARHRADHPELYPGRYIVAGGSGSEHVTSTGAVITDFALHIVDSIEEVKLDVHVHTG